MLNALAPYAPRLEAAMQCYRFPLPRAHGSLVAFLFRLGRAVGLVAPAAAEEQMSRRHRLMLAVDQRRAAERIHRGNKPRFGLSKLAMAYGMGDFDPSSVTTGHGSSEPSPEPTEGRSVRDMEIANRLSIAKRQLKLEEQHRERVRNNRLDDVVASASVMARRRQIALLCKLRRRDALVVDKAVTVRAIKA